MNLSDKFRFISYWPPQVPRRIVGEVATVVFVNERGIEYMLESEVGTRRISHDMLEKIEYRVIPRDPVKTNLALDVSGELVKILALCENPRWTNERRLRIAEIASNLLAELKQQ